MIHSNQDWQDRRRDSWRGLNGAYARNATERQRSARGLAAWQQHAGATASSHANISTSRFCLVLESTLLARQLQQERTGGPQTDLESRVD